MLWCRAGPESAPPAAAGSGSEFTEKRRRFEINIPPSPDRADRWKTRTDGADLLQAASNQRLHRLLKLFRAGADGGDHHLLRRRRLSCSLTLTQRLHGEEVLKSRGRRRYARLDIEPPPLPLPMFATFRKQTGSFMSAKRVSSALLRCSWATSCSSLLIRPSARLPRDASWLLRSSWTREAARFKLSTSSANESAFSCCSA